MEKYVTLNNGVKMPRLGFGVYCLIDGEIAEFQSRDESGLF